MPLPRTPWQTAQWIPNWARPRASTAGVRGQGVHQPGGFILGREVGGQVTPGHGARHRHPHAPSVLEEGARRLGIQPRLVQHVRFIGRQHGHQLHGAVHGQARNQAGRGDARPGTAGWTRRVNQGPRSGAGQGLDVPGARRLQGGPRRRPGRRAPSASTDRAKRSRVMPLMALDWSTGWPKKGSRFSRSSMPRPAVKVANRTITSNMIGTKACQE